jgi:hypothetical protein
LAHRTGKVGIADMGLMFSEASVLESDYQGGTRCESGQWSCLKAPDT